MKEVRIYRVSGLFQGALRKTKFRCRRSRSWSLRMVKMVSRPTERPLSLSPKFNFPHPKSILFSFLERSLGKNVFRRPKITSISKASFLQVRRIRLLDLHRDLGLFPRHNGHDCSLERLWRMGRQVLYPSGLLPALQHWRLHRTGGGRAYQMAQTGKARWVTPV